MITDDLDKATMTAVGHCPRVRTETWGDGTRHVVLQLDSRTDGFTARGLECVLKALPKAISAKTDFIFTRFSDLTAGIGQSGGIERIADDGMRSLMGRFASGEIKLAR